MKRTVIMVALLVELVLALVPVASSRVGDQNEVKYVTETVKLLPTDDTYIDNSQPDSNLGTLNFMNVKIRTGYYAERHDALLKFDLSDLPAQASIEKAVLWLFCVSDIDDNSRVGPRVAGDNWDELTVTWDIRPTYGETVGDVQDIPHSVEEWISWNLTDFIQSEFDDDGVVSLYFYAELGGVGFSTKEEYPSPSYAPYLEITYSLSFTISNAHFEPKRFDPSAGETTTLYFGLSEPAKHVNIKIYDNEHNPVWDIKLKDVSAGLNGVVWSGRDYNGEIVVPGRYVAKLVTASCEGERAKAKASVRVKY